MVESKAVKDERDLGDQKPWIRVRALTTEGLCSLLLKCRQYCPRAAGREGRQMMSEGSVVGEELGISPW